MLFNKDLRNLCGAMPTAVRKLELLFLVFINIISIVHGEIAVVKGEIFLFFFFILLLISIGYPAAPCFWQLILLTYGYDICTY